MRVRREDGAIRRSVRPREVDLEHEEQCGNGNTGRRQKDVERQDVDDVGCDECEREGYETIRQKQGPDDDLGSLDEREHVAGFEERSEKGERGLWLARLREKLQEAV